jgi:phosphoribosyl 1,2-cyclic phosphodiesterase
VELGDRTLIFDAGTGIIGLGRDLLMRSRQTDKPVEALLFISHFHHDHIQGFPFFSPAFLPSSRLFIFGPQTFDRDPEQVLAHNMVPPYFPVSLKEMSASRDIHGMTEYQVVCWTESGHAPQVVASSAMDSTRTDVVRIRVLRSYAHPGGVLVYRVEWRDLVVVYATDTEGYANTDRRLVDFARGADLLIHDAQYTEEHYLGLIPGMRSTQGWGHSTANMAIDVARAANVGRLALFHFDPSYPDQTIAQIEAGARQLFPGTFAAREGMEVILSAGASEVLNDRKVQAPLQVAVR